jgi:hypothetical protein
MKCAIIDTGKPDCPKTILEACKQLGVHAGDGIYVIPDFVAFQHKLVQLASEV